MARQGKAKVFDQFISIFICSFAVVWGGHDIYQSVLLGATSAPMSGRMVSFANWPRVFMITLLVKLVIYGGAFCYLVSCVREKIKGRRIKGRRKKTNRARLR